MRDRIAGRLFGGEPEATETIAGKRIVDRIASGAAGDVYLAHDDSLDRTIAIKVLRGPGDSDEAELRRVHREARTLARLAHPNVVHVYEVGVDDGRLYIAMEYVPGMSLSQWQRSAPRSVDEIVRCYTEAARGLSAAHAVGIIHRDVKPANILVGDDGRVRVVDFGLARTIEEDGEAAPGSPRSERRGSSRSPWQLGTESRYTCGGTPAYMAPESLRKGLTGPQSDQFSWAVSLYEALYGKRPYDTARARDLETRVALRVDIETQANEPVPAWLRAVLRRALSWDTDGRFASMDAIVVAISAGPGRRTAQRRSVAFVAAVGATACVTWLAFSPTPPCAEPGAPLRGVWDDAARRDVTSAFARTGFDFANTTATYVTTRLDEYAAGWTATRAEACEATKLHEERSEEAYDLTQTCLELRADRIRDVVFRLGRVDAEMIGRIDQVLRVLPPLDECRDIALLREDGALAREHDPEVIEVRKLLAVASLATLRSDREQAERAAADAVAAAQQIELSPLVAEALLIRAEVDARAGDVQRARDSLLTALDEAERGHHDIIKPKIWLALARISAQLSEDGPTALGYVQRARASLVRLGSEPESDPDWLETSGLAQAAAGSLAAAEEHLVRAIELRRTSADSLALAKSMTLLANALPFERAGDARVLYGEAMHLRAEALGWEHPLVVDLEFNLGVLALDEDDIVAAKRAFQHALVVNSTVLGNTAPRLATIHVALAEVANREAEHEKAILEASRALELHSEEPSVSPAAFRALANAHHALGQDEAALAANLSALELETGRRPELELARFRINAGENLSKARRHAEARLHYQRVADTLASETDATSREVYAYAMNGLGKVDVSMGALAAALASFEVARTLEREFAVRDLPLVAELELGTAQAYRALGSEDLALAHAERAIAACAGGGDSLAAEQEVARRFIASGLGKAQRRRPEQVPSGRRG